MNKVYEGLDGVCWMNFCIVVVVFLFCLVKIVIVFVGLCLFCVVIVIVVGFVNLVV